MKWENQEYMLKQIYNIAVRECGLIRQNRIYLFCMLIFPIVMAAFFTSLMQEGVPTEMPVGVVDMDRSSASRALIRRLDGMQTSHVTVHYSTISEARKGIQQGKIYACLLVPKGFEHGLMNNTRPQLSFYYSNTSLVAGSLLMRDLKTTTLLASASVGMQKLSALGKTEEEIQTFLQPISVDLHMVGNPFANYNYYLSTFIVPGVLMVFIFLLTPYCIGTELKFKRAHEWMSLADNNPHIALVGKLLPHTLIFLTIFLGYELYIYHVLHFPHPGGVGPILLLGITSVLACQGFGVFAFGLMPSLRMSMSICSLWAVLSFSICGATFPLSAMDSPIQAIGQLFPLRHYCMAYQTCVLDGFPLSAATFHWGALLLFMLLPALTVWHIKKAMLVYKYIP